MVAPFDLRGDEMTGFRWLQPLLLGCALMLSSKALWAADGKALFAPCSACHGSRGEGNTALGAPAIAGQDAAYLQRQLQHFRAGRRGTHQSDTFGAQMRTAGMATLKDDAAIAAVAAHVAAMPKSQPVAPAKGDLRNGNNNYHGKCGACHGGRAEGNAELKAPRLAGLDAAYLARQFAHFRDGVRGTDPKDVPGRQMAMMATTLPARRDLDDVIAFIHQQDRPK